jgi:hypothetical protein
MVERKPEYVKQKMRNTPVKTKKKALQVQRFK